MSYLQKRPSNAPFPLLSLPLDLLYTLTADHLDPVSATTLSLTCRSLSSCFLPLALRRLSSRQDKLTLLSLLEKSTPGSVLCFACMKLHRADSKPTGLPRSVFELGWSCKYAHAWMPSAPDSLGLSFRDARAVMLYRTGEWPMGLPVSSLNTKVHDPYRLLAPGGISRAVTTERTAKVIANDLLVRYSYTFHIHGLPTPVVASAMESLRFGVCQHVQVSGQAVLDAVAGVGDELPGDAEVEGRTRACGRCQMDYAVSWGVKDGREVVVVRSWHCFGDVREPWDGEWGRAVARRRTSVGGKGEEGEADDGGVVQATWESG